MVGFLNSGDKGLYVEGADIGYYNADDNVLWPCLGTSYDGDGNGSGNVSSMTGMTGSIADGFNVSFPPYGVSGGPDSYVDEFSAVGNGTVIFQCQNNIGRVVSNVGGTYKNEYHTITASPCFTYYTGGTDYMDNLMEVYLDFLGEGASGIKSVSLGEIKAAMK